MITIYHNPRCGKSRETLKLLEDCGEEFEIVEYLKNPPSKERLKEISTLLGLEPVDFVRKKETLFQEKYANQDLSEDDWLTVLSTNPILIERPIVVKGDKAVIGRPPENVKELF